MSNPKFKFIGTHPEDLADGRPVAPGEYVNLSDEDLEEPHNQALIADGKLIGTGSKSEEEAGKIVTKTERAQQRAAREEGNREEE